MSLVKVSCATLFDSIIDDLSSINVTGLAGVSMTGAAVCHESWPVAVLFRSQNFVYVHKSEK